MLSLADVNQSEVVEAFNSTSRYVDGQLNIDKFLNVQSYLITFQNFN